MNRTTVIGIDSGLNSTGVVIMYADDFSVVYEGAIRQPGAALGKIDRILSTCADLERIIRECVPVGTLVSAVTEYHALHISRKSNRLHDIGMIDGNIYALLKRLGIQWAEVHPNDIKLFACGVRRIKGKGDKKKEPIMLAVLTQWGRDYTNCYGGDDIADAYIMARMGAVALNAANTGMVEESGDTKLSSLVGIMNSFSVPTAYGRIKNVARGR